MLLLLCVYVCYFAERHFEVHHVYFLECLSISTRGFALYLNSDHFNSKQICLNVLKGPYLLEKRKIWHFVCWSGYLEHAEDISIKEKKKVEILYIFLFNWNWSILSYSSSLGWGIYFYCIWKTFSQSRDIVLVVGWPEYDSSLLAHSLILRFFSLFFLTCLLHLKPGRAE